MSLWRQLSRGLRVLHPPRGSRPGPRRRGRALSRAGHRRARRHAAFSPEEARRAARLSWAARSRRASRCAARVGERRRRRGWPTCATPRGACARTPGFTALAVLTLALGIGATTAIFSAVNPVLFEPLPYPDPERIVTISDVGSDGARLDVTFGTYPRAGAAEPLVRRARGAQALAADARRARRARAARRAAGQRGLLPDARRGAGARARLHRGRRPPDGPNVVILERRALAARFGGDPAIVGRTVTLDDTPYTVIGVMPERFENVLAPSAELWAPLQYGESFAPDSRAWGHHLRMVGRLRPGVDREAAARELARHRGHAGARVAAGPLGRPRSGLLLSSLQRRGHAGRQAGAARRPRRGPPGARDHVCQRDQPAARPRRAAARRVRDAGRARRRAGPADPPAADREPAARGGGRRARAWPSPRSACGRWWRSARPACPGSTRSGWTAACSPSRCALTRSSASPSGVIPALQASTPGTAGRRAAELRAARPATTGAPGLAGRGRGGAGAGAAGERGPPVPEPRAALRGGHRLRRRSRCSRCRCRSPAIASTRTASRYGFFAAGLEAVRACPASPRRRSPASCR